MNFRITAYLLGKLAVACAMALCIPLAVAVLYNEEHGRQAREYFL